MVFERIRCKSTESCNGVQLIAGEYRVATGSTCVLALLLLPISSAAHFYIVSMARMLNTETLGALVDKLSIVNLKLWHCQELLYSSTEPPPEERKRLEEKNASLLEQRARLIEIIDRWIEQATADPTDMVITNPQNKLYGRFRTDLEL